MSTQLSTFVNQIKRKFNDYTAYTESLIKDATNSRVQDFSDRFNWRDLNADISFDTITGTAQYDLAGFLTPVITTEGILSVKTSCTLESLKLLSRERARELSLDTTQTGEPTHIIVDSNTKFSLYPVPNGAYALSLQCRGKHPTLTADSQYFSFTDDKVEIIRQGVIADIFEDKDDNRTSVYERKYEIGIKHKKSNQRRGINESNQSLKLGSSLE